MPMDLATALLWVLVLAALSAMSGLSYMVVKVMAIGRKPVYSAPAGSAGAGARYVLGQGMLPWEKESSARHLPTYLAGVIFHIGIFTAFGWLIFGIISAQEVPRAPLLIQVIAGCALAAGLGLLIKRLTQRAMRFISGPDDYFANVLLGLFLTCSVIAMRSPGLTIWTHAAAAVVLVYLPFGKVRHCVFFFLSKLALGRTLGRRGVLPPPRGRYSQ